MLPAFLTTICFSISIICGNRSAKLIGGSEANFWRLTFATIFLSIWACTWGQGLSGGSFPLFLLSGVIGIGLGDMALFQALPRLGSRLTMLLVQCLAAPFAAMIEYFWLGTRLTPLQMLCGGIILAGIAISLSGGSHVQLQKRPALIGIIFSVLAAFGNGFGAVLSRKAYEVAGNEGTHIDGGTAAFQRILGGLLIGGIFLLAVKWRSIKSHLAMDDDRETLPSKEKWRRVLPWVLANSFMGQTLGVSCFQWAFQTTPTGIVLPIVATTPLVAVPFAMTFEKEKPSVHSLVGGVIAVGGVVALAYIQTHLPKP